MVCGIIFIMYKYERGVFLKALNIKSLLQKDIPKKWFWLGIALFTASKLILCSFQLMYASPELSPIDDTLMFNLANNISSGNWLGEYGWLTLSKHSFYALWLSFLNLLGVNIIVGAQALYAVACLVAVQAIAPMVKSLSRLIIFVFMLYIPTSYAEFTLRVYRDQIYPALVLIAMGAMAGAYIRYKQEPEKIAAWLVLSGLGYGAAWLTHEDNALLIPFAVVATIVFIFYIYKDKSIKKKLSHSSICLVSLITCLLCCGAWAGMNFLHYGRFVISDFTSGEFNDAMGALSRVNPDAQKQYVLVPNETRHMIYDISPSFALLKPYLESTDMYNSYGSVADQELGSGGVHWAVRSAAAKAGFYRDAQVSRQYFTAVAKEINAACEADLVPASGKRSGVLAPFNAEYILPTLERFEESLRTMMVYFQNKPSTDLSIATPQQSEEWETYLHCESTKSAIANTALAYYSPMQKLAIFILECITWVYRILIYPLILMWGLWLISYFKRVFADIKQKNLSVITLGETMILGLFLTGLLRIAAISYLMAVTMKIATLSAGVYIMYLAPACAPMLLLLLYGTIKAIINIEPKKERVKK